MKVYNKLKKIENPCKPIKVYGRNNSILYKGVLNNIPWHIAKCELKRSWEGEDGIFRIFITE